MRKIVAITYVSLDGVMQGPGGPDEDRSGGFALGGWTVPFWDEMMGGLLTGLIEGAFDLLLGRRTYDLWAGYWPQNADNRIGRKFDAATKYVMTRGAPDLGWVRSQRIAGDAAQGVADLKAGAGPDLHVWGSGDALQSLIATGLVDEYRTWIFPVLLGDGKRLFRPGLPATSLALTGSQVSTTGVLINTYRPDGPARTGAVTSAADDGS
ncbi:dihydrofolate reductase family protein [Paracoccus sp. CPCC 101403]|uniref:Dihydrofolate reductase family protein n=1 Tax=Paracoccus broussonetiae TaxID=3075834 RepID=A0ABU3EE05_9RHOB|nr:dihydrofolate reductase family protein [Paracoccus sp. CPCC 101403]MDT1062472.1 dihydrofolate reductase family protein [Paracoccus sp. CPCC 101403]